MAGGEALAEVFGEDFAEFDAPLVEAVDAPDGAADEDAVFVQGDERAQAERQHLVPAGEAGQQLGLPPAAIAGGVDSVMSAHIALPKVDETRVPSTISPVKTPT